MAVACLPAGDLPAPNTGDKYAFPPFPLHALTFLPLSAQISGESYAPDFGWIAGRPCRSKSRMHMKNVNAS